MIKQLNDSDRAQLASLAQLPGFKAFLLLCDNEIEQMKLDIFTLPPTEREKILALHNRAQAAILFYQDVTKEMSSQIEIFLGRQKMGEVAPDPTAALYE